MELREEPSSSDAATSKLVLKVQASIQVLKQKFAKA
ncbi:hypothetical protein M892_27595 [Vibrio campbellii ATCC BAA-1116]|uniref:Uncharacterized protein n=1 Tax=Vibrio campbellii (strain ATCC BAA-1116) TaxID=2902295 RepID=A7N7X2_VIBC1|nr:hypothetical protein VIBHAR_07075 [Vibrio campbellii ATCC BAA-1116]AGU98983.1 hypothetical protein M892_27595 [Vibrio campbellii ATCC BAA-1116]